MRDRIQVESIDEDLRNGLWNLLTLHVWNHVKNPGQNWNMRSSENREINALCLKLWHNYFKKPIDQLSDHWSNVHDVLRKYFFGCPWYEVYDFLEFIHNNYDKHQFSEKFAASCNTILERESSAYRFVSGSIASITEPSEIAEVEAAISSSPSPVRAHLDRALDLLTSRDSPDYRNSVKESISAVESLVSLRLGTDKGTLGQMLKQLEESGNLHPALKAAFSSLYGYTSDQGGVRHALLDKDSVVHAYAQFMLVTCSAFINYVQHSRAEG